MGGFQHFMIWRDLCELVNVWTPSPSQKLSCFSFCLSLTSPWISRGCLYRGAEWGTSPDIKTMQAGPKIFFLSHGLLDNLSSEELAAQFSSCQVALEGK